MAEQFSLLLVNHIPSGALSNFGSNKEHARVEDCTQKETVQSHHLICSRCLLLFNYSESFLSSMISAPRNEKRPDGPLKTGSFPSLDLKSIVQSRNLCTFLIFVVGFVIGFGSTDGLWMLEWWASAPCGTPTLPFPVPWHPNWSAAINMTREELRNVPGMEVDFNGVAPLGNMSAVEWMYHKVPILCWVTVHELPWTELPHLKRAWGHRCNSLLFFGPRGNQTVPREIAKEFILLDMKEPTEVRRLWLEASYIFTRYRNDSYWFLNVDETTFAIVENLRYMALSWVLSKESEKIKLTEDLPPAYFGFNRSSISKEAIAAGLNVKSLSGFMINRPALDKFMEINVSKCPTDLRNPLLSLELCMDSHGIQLKNTRDDEGRLRFHNANPADYIFFEKRFPDWIFNATKRSYFDNNVLHLRRPQLQPACCSPLSVTFADIHPRDMHSYAFLVYHLTVYGEYAEQRAEFGKMLQELRQLIQVREVL